MELGALLEKAGSVAVAYSGGVDSTYLLKIAYDILGDRAVAITVRSSVIPAREMEEAERFCKKLGVRQIMVDADVFGIEKFAENPPDRCYYCKKYLFSLIIEAAASLGITYVCDGSNYDDRSDYRPGMTALAELGVRSPLMEAGMTKEMIREESRKLGLPTWNRQSMACLASRFAYGETITEEGLRAVETAEDVLRKLGLDQYRVRVHGKLARIEVRPADMPRIAELRAEIIAKLKSVGFTYVTMDLEGYRTGSMNEALK